MGDIYSLYDWRGDLLYVKYNLNKSGKDTRFVDARIEYVTELIQNAIGHIHNALAVGTKRQAPSQNQTAGGYERKHSPLDDPASGWDGS